MFDALTDCVRKDFKEEMLKGTILVSPEDTEEYFAFFVKNQITDNRPSKGDDSIANEQLSFIFRQLMELITILLLPNSWTFMLHRNLPRKYFHLLLFKVRK